MRSRCFFRIHFSDFVDYDFAQHDKERSGMTEGHGMTELRDMTEFWHLKAGFYPLYNMVIHKFAIYIAKQGITFYFLQITNDNT